MPPSKSPTVAQLKAELKARGLPTSGLKTELIDRLASAQLRSPSVPTVTRAQSWPSSARKVSSPRDDEESDEALSSASGSLAGSADIGTVFSTLDANQDGVISREELEHGIQHHREVLAQAINSPHVASKAPGEL